MTLVALQFVDSLLEKKKKYWNTLVVRKALKFHGLTHKTFSLFFFFYCIHGISIFLSLSRPPTHPRPPCLSPWQRRDSGLKTVN